jgi:predicted Zn-ribbon and HTH transcriptional regulator
VSTDDTRPDLSVPLDEYPAFRAPQAAAEPPAVTSPAPVPAEAATAILGVGEGSSGEAPPSPPEASREALGRLVHAERLAVNAAKERPFYLLPWEERSGEQRELDMRIGEAVARAVTASYENATTWGTSCPSCAAVLDSAAAERERAEQAEETLALIRSLCGEGAPAVAVDRIEAILGTQERSDEEAPILSARCTGCGEQFADSETDEYLFATRERMERLLDADGWLPDPPLCRACQPDGEAP